MEKYYSKFYGEKVQYPFVCVFLSEVAKGTREMTQNSQEG